ncbi:MAG: hypothetical protein F6K40_24730 [Okeania sp. SIO3I5]|uniref:hypothetical protein n=1 Tax=Okeania sp. SIO3I5 TaxID=2607805 RepID=UPI0013B9DB21|nr:hypothetical protein [Okeania sp. SIO3I5]NEQ39283.1 hypothetical protein [Okeania sp. SIO3I5]
MAEFQDLLRIAIFLFATNNFCHSNKTGKVIFILAYWLVFKGKDRKTLAFVLRSNKFKILALLIPSL